MRRRTRIGCSDEATRREVWEQAEEDRATVQVKPESSSRGMHWSCLGRGIAKTLSLHLRSRNILEPKECGRLVCGLVSRPGGVDVKADCRA
jgi:hypothetical protein